MKLYVNEFGFCCGELGGGGVVYNLWMGYSVDPPRRTLRQICWQLHGVPSRRRPSNFQLSWGPVYLSVVLTSPMIGFDVFKRFCVKKGEKFSTLASPRSERTGVLPQSHFLYSSSVPTEHNNDDIHNNLPWFFSNDCYHTELKTYFIKNYLPPSFVIDFFALLVHPLICKINSC